MKYYDWEIIEEGDKNSIYALFSTLASSGSMCGLKILLHEEEIILYENNNIFIPPKLCLEEFNDGDRCPHCKGVRNSNGFWKRQNTHYEDAESNWAFLCEKCHEENDEHWAEMWAEYHAGVL